MNPDELLLRDIHLPDPVSWWPPASGWWLLAAIITGMIAAIFWWRRRLITKRNAPATLARRELDSLKTAWTEHRDSQRLVNDVSTWLRRAGMSLSSRHRAASPTGDQWRQCLEDIAGEPVFNDANDRLITAAPYQAVTDPVDGEHLLNLCERWLDATNRKARQA
jgi:hypothetical protein